MENKIINRYSILESHILIIILNISKFGELLQNIRRWIIVRNKDQHIYIAKILLISSKIIINFYTMFALSYLKITNNTDLQCTVIL